jgi:hypothetical protein
MNALRIVVVIVLIAMIGIVQSLREKVSDLEHIVKNQNDRIERIELQENLNGNIQDNTRP